MPVISADAEDSYYICVRNFMCLLFHSALGTFLYLKYAPYFDSYCRLFGFSPSGRAGMDIENMPRQIDIII